MIRILATALLALILTASGAFATAMHDLVMTEGLYYKKFTDVPFTGKLDEGLERGVIRNGKCEGPWVGYRSNGQIFHKGECRNGEWEGPWVGYYASGQLRYKGEYRNGKKEGPWVDYEGDGTKVEYLTGTYRDGEKVSD